MISNGDYFSFNIYSGKINFDGTNIIASLASGNVMLKFNYKTDDTNKIGRMFIPNDNDIGFNQVGIIKNKIIIAPFNKKGKLYTIQ